MYLLSMELFGENMIVRDFPKLKAIRGLGMSDMEGYAAILAGKFDYTNTYYDREPRFDFTERHSSMAGSFDFILSADVLEHIAPEVEAALLETHRLLKPQGFFGVTVFCNSTDNMREHFPDLNEFRIVPLGASHVLINRRSDGTLQIRDDLIFHGGTGATLEMREFGATELRRKLLQAGFSGVEYLTDNLPSIGVLFDSDVSQPLIARKEPYTMNACTRTQLVREWGAVQESHELLKRKIELALRSRWLRLGRIFGLGPKPGAF